MLDYSRPPFTQWFVGGKTNLRHNAVDSWAVTRAERPALIAISTETGSQTVYLSRGGKAIAYKPLPDAAIGLAAHKPDKVLLVDRGLAAMDLVAGRDIDYATLRALHIDARVAVAWLESNEASHILYALGTTGSHVGRAADVPQPGLVLGRVLPYEGRADRDVYAVCF